MKKWNRLEIYTLTALSLMRTPMKREVGWAVSLSRKVMPYRSYKSVKDKLARLEGRKK